MAKGERRTSEGEVTVLDENEAASQHDKVSIPDQTRKVQPGQIVMHEVCPGVRRPAIVIAVHDGLADLQVFTNGDRDVSLFGQRSKQLTIWIPDVMISGL